MAETRRTAPLPVRPCKPLKPRQVAFGAYSLLTRLPTFGLGLPSVHTERPLAKSSLGLVISSGPLRSMNAMSCAYHFLYHSYGGVPRAESESYALEIVFLLDKEERERPLPKTWVSA